MEDLIKIESDQKQKVKEKFDLITQMLLACAKLKVNVFKLDVLNNFFL